MAAKTTRTARNATKKTRTLIRPPLLEKLSLHPRNRHRDRYDFAALSQALPALEGFLVANPFDANELTINFANPAAVMALNAALLKVFYAVESWHVPPGYLCPPIPGRADYVHHAADLLARDHNGSIPRGPEIRVLDIGVGANCIYPLIGHHEYGWRFVGSDTDAVALSAAQRIVDANAGLAAAIEFRQQSTPQKIFEGILTSDDRFDFVLCNPPFHASARAAEAAARRKWKNLGKGGNPESNPKLNFGGQAGELWCEGGEVGFVCRMVAESARQQTQTQAQVSWFSALVSREENLSEIYSALKAAGARKVETIAMAQGQKKSRIVAWHFREKFQPTMTPQTTRATIPGIRTANIGDLPAIVDVTNRAFRAERFCVTGDRTEAADIRQRFATGIFFLIDDPSDRAPLLGSVFCSVENSRGYLGLLSVDPDAQGQGHARTLVAAVEQHCRQAGCNFLDITVVNVRNELFPFYAKLGFAAIDVLPFPLPARALQPLHLVKMTKPLLAP